MDGAFVGFSLVVPSFASSPANSFPVCMSVLELYVCGFCVGSSIFVTLWLL